MQLNHNMEFIKKIIQKKKEHRKQIIIAGVILIFVIVIGSRSLGKEAAQKNEAVIPAVSMIDLTAYTDDQAVVHGTG